MTQVTFGGLPYMPLKEQWLSECPLFLSGDARLSRAVVRMLFAAWRNSPAGSIAPSYASISAVSGLTNEEIAANYEALTYGWELRDERLFHMEMSALCERLAERHGEVIAQLAEDAAVAAQEPCSFELTAAHAEPHRNKGRRALRPTWRPSADSVKEMIKLGLKEEADREYIVNKMRNWARSSGEKKADWDATLLNFVASEPSRNYPSQKSVVPLVPVASSRFSGLVSKGEAALSHNENVFNRVRQEA